jgi:hypothetical protein
VVLVPLGLLDSLDRRAQQDFLDLPALVDRLVVWVNRGALVLLDPLDQLDRQDKKVRVGRLARVDRLD